MEQTCFFTQPMARPLNSEGFFVWFAKKKQVPGWWQLKYFLFLPRKFGEDVHPFWRSYFVQMGWFNHQLDYLFWGRSNNVKIYGHFVWFSLHSVMFRTWLKKKGRKTPKNLIFEQTRSNQLPEWDRPTLRLISFPLKIYKQTPLENGWSWLEYELCFLFG